MDKKTVLATLNRLFPELKLRFKVIELALFGSYARDENRKESDIDLVVNFDEEADFLTLMGLTDYLENIFSCKVDISTNSSIKPQIKESISKDLIKI